MRIIPLDEGSRKNILEDLLKRDPNQYSQYADTVSAIVERVKKDKDEALFSYTLQFDKAEISAENVRVNRWKISENITSARCVRAGFPVSRTGRF